jgi:hypothetical protein
MATKIYEEHTVYLINGTGLKISPLKIKYLHEVMETFSLVDKAENDFEAIAVMAECVRVSMKQYMPDLSISVDCIEDNFDLPTIYKILDYAAGIKLNTEAQEDVKEQAKESGSTWSDLDLVKLETELFLLGSWKNYDDLEKSISMPELLSTISTKRDLDHMEKKFLAAMQGVDLDKGKDEEDAWEAMKNRVFNKKGTNPNDIVNLSGKEAVQAGFGIGHGLEYEEV